MFKGTKVTLPKGKLNHPQFKNNQNFWDSILCDAFSNDIVNFLVKLTKQ